MPTRTTGAARWFTETQLGGPTREAETQLTVQTTTTPIVGINGDRVGLVIVNNGSFDIFVSTTPTGALQGIRLGANGGNVTMTVRDDYTVVSRQWFGISSGGASSTYALETISDITMAVEQIP